MEVSVFASLKIGQGINKNLWREKKIFVSYLKALKICIINFLEKFMSKFPIKNAVFQKL